MVDPYTYDLFHLIHQVIEKRVCSVLNQESPNHHIKNFCPPCTNKLSNESGLKFNILYSIDGGNSYQCFREAGSASENFQLQCDYILTQETVNKLQHVIKRSVVVSKHTKLK